MPFASEENMASFGDGIFDMFLHLLYRGIID
jgi:hypothetical protein